MRLKFLWIVRESSSWEPASELDPLRDARKSCFSKLVDVVGAARSSSSTPGRSNTSCVMRAIASGRRQKETLISLRGCFRTALVRAWFTDVAFQSIASSSSPVEGKTKSNCVRKGSLILYSPVFFPPFSTATFFSGLGLGITRSRAGFSLLSSVWVS